MMTIVLPLVPVCAIILGFVFRESPGIRVLAVLAILASMVLGVGPLIAPHRLAEVKHQSGRPSDEWLAGSYETTKVVRSVYAPLISSIIALAALSLFPSKRRKLKDEVVMDTEW